MDELKRGWRNTWQARAKAEESLLNFGIFPRRKRKSMYCVDTSQKLEEPLPAAYQRKKSL